MTGLQHLLENGMTIDSLLETVTKKAMLIQRLEDP